MLIILLWLKTLRPILNLLSLKLMIESELLIVLVKATSKLGQGQFGQMVECLFKNWVVLGSSPVAVTSPSDFVPASSKEFLDIQATIEYGFTLKRVHDMTRTYSQTHTVVYWWDKFQTICKISTYDQLYKEGFYDQQCQTPSGDEQKTNKQNSLYQELLILNYDRHPHPLLQVGGLEN